MYKFCLTASLMLCCAISSAGETPMPVRARVVAEEIITDFVEPNNGSGPMWCFGSRTIARIGDTVFAVVPETGKDVKPLCNTRWVLYRRRDAGKWERVQANPTYDEREPCMLARTPDGRLILSVNPAQELTYTMEDGRRGARCLPMLLQFDSAAPEKAPVKIMPKWDHAYDFSEHSYRALAADATTGSLFMTDQVPVGGEYLHAFSAYDGKEQPLRQGLLQFPMRGCYQQIAIRGNAVYVMAISDEMEPNPVWRAYKEEMTKQHWDYEFRQLFFTWTPNVAATDFSPVLTVASRDETAGLIRNLDMWVDREGAAWLLYTDRNIWQPYMRDKFFPGTPITVALKYARVQKGRVIDRQTLLQTAEKMTPEGKGTGQLQDAVPEYGEFHATPDGRLFVIWYQSGENAGNYLQQINPEPGQPQKLPLEKPLSSFFTASERNGCLPSDIIDLYGLPAGGGAVIRYAQVRLE